MKLNIHLECFANEERPFNRRDKVSSFILPEILVKMREQTKSFDSLFT